MESTTTIQVLNNAAARIRQRQSTAAKLNTDAGGAHASPSDLPVERPPASELAMHGEGSFVRPRALVDNRWRGGTQATGPGADR
jgi:hypothetical protein